MSARASVRVTSASKNGTLDASPLGLGGGVVLSVPWSSTTSSIATQSAHSAYAWLLTDVGDLPQDQVDTLVISDITSLGTAGHLWTSDTQTGLGNDGYGTITG